MKKGWLYSLLGIFLCLLTLGGVTINSIYRIQRHGSLINYTGIVRGASQKLIKMELNDIQGDDLILYIDEILDSLTEGSGVYDLPLPDDENYQSKLGKTKEAWEQIKKQIYITRKDSGNMAAKNQLLQDSEQFFNTTNDMVICGGILYKSTCKAVNAAGYHHVCMCAGLMDFYFYYEYTKDPAAGNLQS